jgi:hypothetical protein
LNLPVPTSPRRVPRSRRYVAGVLLSVLALSGCSDVPESQQRRVTDPPSVGPGDIPTPSQTPLTTIPKPTAPWPTPRITGEPPKDAPLGRRIRFAIAKQAQVVAGRAAPTTVDCPGLDDVEGSTRLTCTVTYAGRKYTGTLTVNPRRYSASYRFTSQSVPIVKGKVIDAVLRVAPNPHRVTCEMDDVAVVRHSVGVACDVATTGNAVVPYRARISGDGKVHVVKA